jgi:hypothetical protein
MAAALLMIWRYGAQAVQILTQLLDLRLELRVFPSETALFLLYRLDLFSLPQATLGGCHFVLLVVMLFSLVGKDGGSAVTITLMVVFSRCLGLAMSLVRSVASSTCLYALAYQ